MIKEIFNSIMGEGKYIGRRFIFLRFDKCPLNCIYCDESKKEYKGCEISPGSEKFKKIDNNIKEVIRCIENLTTPDLFAVSFTGGEPLVYYEFCRELNSILKNKGYRTFLESNGIYPEKLFKVDIASIDIKLKEHFINIDDNLYKMIYNNELKTIEKLYKMGVDVYAKIVILKNTDINNIKKIAQDLSEIGEILLCLQPLTPINNLQPPSKELLFKIMEECGKYLGDNVMLTIQMHKYLGVL